MSVTQIESIVERLQRSANVRSVFGDPIERDDRTVVPVAQVAYGFGGGYGRDDSHDTSSEEGNDGEAGGDGAGGAGAGGGGGAAARPVGALEITDDATRFVRFKRRRQSVALLLVGLAVGWLVGRRSSGE